uniref:NADH dehydrogenase subunit 6 n=1 Tax=Tristichotrochus unicus TaxID=499927 RepID=UPI00226D14A7|nr:NADH dehydrogenase subunit 6 [Tristichotrochus unicus]UZN92192.1 NADH dehydrogenase subunit 6 [Tristichotrochus unicus]
MLSFCVSLLFLMMSMLQPLSLGACIMGLSVMFCLLIGVSVSSWYGFVLFLIFVGGLLVMFAYVSALAPNNFFSSAKSVVRFVVLYLFVLAYFSSGGPLSVSFISHNHLGLGSEIEWLKSSVCAGGALVSPSSISLIIVLGTVLLIALLAVVKICYYQQGPLRSHSSLK